MKRVMVKLKDSWNTSGPFSPILVPEHISSVEHILPVWNTSVPDYEIAVFKTHQFRVYNTPVLEHISAI